MKNYNYGDNTLLHSVGFNPYKIESVLRYGILSKNESERQNIPFTKSYLGYNFDNFISMVRYMYVNFDDENSSYNKYARKGVSFIVENQDFIYNQNDMYFNYSDEVFVKDKVPVENIVGISVPKKYLSYELKDLPMIPLKSSSYLNIKHTCDDLIGYLSSINYKVNKDEYNIYLKEIYNTVLALEKDTADHNLQNDFMDSKLALNEFIAEQVNLAFDVLLKTENCNLEEMLGYIIERTRNLDIYPIDIDKLRI